MTNDTQSGEAARLLDMCEFWFSPWGAWKSAKWEEYGNDGKMTPEAMLQAIEAQSKRVRDAMKIAQPTGRTDSERLDWLQTNLATIEFRLREQWCVIISREISSNGPTIVEAIDAAMDSEKEAE